MGPIVANGALTLQGGCSGCEIISSLMLQIQPALGALGIPLCLLGCVGAVIGALQAVPGIVGPPPDPSGLVTALEAVAKKCACVIEFALPPPAGTICQILVFTDDVLKVIFAATTCVLGLMQHLFSLRLSATTYLTSVFITEREVGSCLNAQVQDMMDALNARFGSIQGLLSLLDPLFQLLGSIPGLGSAFTTLRNGFATFTIASPAGTTPEAYLSALLDLQSVLTDVLNIINPIAALCPQ